jgi:membrane fusion protein (multidrug efflux system)
VQLREANLKRSGRLLEVGAQAPAELDSAQAEARAAEARARSVRTAIAKKTIRAPFSGRLGIRQVQLGEFLDTGAPIVSLQSFDPIYVDFTLPQRELPKLATGQSVQVTTDAFAGERFAGKITTIHPELDPETRNVQLQATLANAKGKRVLTVPATAVIYAPYGDSVFVVERKLIKARGRVGDVARQQFVRLGETRGDIVSVVSGLKPGERVVTSGAFKLRTGTEVAIQRGMAPDAKLAPNPKDT